MESGEHSEIWKNRAKPTLAKIVATIGPASESAENVQRLIKAGVSVFRFNFSHGTPGEHEARLKTVRACASELGAPTGVLGDLQGPKIRVGKVAQGGVEVRVGDDVVFDPAVDVAEGRGGGVEVFGCTYDGIGRDVQAGDRVLVNDGAIRLLAVEREAGDPESALRCRVLVGGLITSGKGINLPESDVGVSAITDRDWEWVAWSVEHGVDFLALSFVRHADEVLRLKAALEGMCSVDKDVGTGEAAQIPVIAKIEKPQALEEIDGILDAADGIMVARGDLGVEMDLAKVPVVQGELIRKADEWGKPCIVATQMLETMIENIMPTRAEVSDVANAIFEGTDAVMLSGETAVGKHPDVVVEMMRRVIEQAETHVHTTARGSSHGPRLRDSQYRTAALAHGAYHAAHDVGAKLVVCWSQRGGTARYLSQTGLRVPIIAYSSKRREVRRMSLLRCVTPLRMDVPGGGSLAAWNRRVDEDLLRRGWADPGDAIVLLAGYPLGERGATNSMAVHFVDDASSGFMLHG